MEKLIDLGREPICGDVDLATVIGGFNSALPVFVAAFGSTRVASGDLGEAVARQAGSLGVPMVIGENIVPVSGYGRMAEEKGSLLLRRITEYASSARDGLGGVVVQQSTEDADAEVWNLVYSDPSARPLLESGRLAFELKVGQGAKPGVGGMTLVPRERAAELAAQYDVLDIYDAAEDSVLRCSSPGTFTEEVLRQQIRLMRNNYPRCRVWVKLPPSRDIHLAAAVAWAAGADSVTVDGAEGGTGWAPAPSSTTWASLLWSAWSASTPRATPFWSAAASGRALVRSSAWRSERPRWVSDGPPWSPRTRTRRRA